MKPQRCALFTVFALSCMPFQASAIDPERLKFENEIKQRYSKEIEAAQTEEDCINLVKHHTLAGVFCKEALASPQKNTLPSGEEKPVEKEPLSFTKSTTNNTIPVPKKTGDGPGGKCRPPTDRYGKACVTFKEYAVSPAEVYLRLNFNTECNASDITVYATTDLNVKKSGRPSKDKPVFSISCNRAKKGGSCINTFLDFQPYTNACKPSQ